MGGGGSDGGGGDGGGGAGGGGGGVQKSQKCDDVIYEWSLTRLIKLDAGRKIGKIHIHKNELNCWIQLAR